MNVLVDVPVTGKSRVPSVAVQYLVMGSSLFPCFRVLAVPVVDDSSVTLVLPCFASTVFDTSVPSVSVFRQGAEASGAVRCRSTV